MKLPTLISVLVLSSSHADAVTTSKNNLRGEFRQLKGEPTNNDCSSAQNLILPASLDSLSETSGTTNSATTSSIFGLADTDGPTVWYRFIGTGQTFEVNLDCGSTPFNAAVKVLSGNGCDVYAGQYFGSGDMCQNGVSIFVDTLTDVEYFVIVEGIDFDSEVPSTGDFTLILHDDSFDAPNVPTTVPSQAPSETPIAPAPQRFRLAAGDSQNYLTVGDTRSGCNRFIVSNPPMVTRPLRNVDNSDSQIFILHPNGQLENEMCRQLYVAVDRNRGLNCCTFDALQDEAVDSSCARGEIALRQAGGLHLTHWDLQQTRVGSSDHYALFASDCDFTDNRAMQHDLDAEGSVELGSFGPESQGSFGPLESGKVFEWRFEPVP